MKASIITIIALLSIASVAQAAKSNIIVRNEGKAKTIFINDMQFIEVTPTGERYYCEDDNKGKSHCTLEAKLNTETQEQSDAVRYAICVHSQLTYWDKHFKTYYAAVLKAQSKCEKLLPEVVECSTDGDCCTKNAVRCDAENELDEAREASQK